MRTLLPYQSAWVGDPAPLAVIEKSRRIGISWAEAYHAVMHAGTGRGDIYYQSYARDMTRGFIDDCAGWAEDLDIAAGAAGEVLIHDEGRDIQAFRIALASGKQILAMTSSPRGFRGKGRPGDVAVIDEAAFVDTLDAVLKAALAFLTWGGRVRIISTHNGEANPFNTLVRDIREARQPGTLHRVTLRDALAQGLYGRIAQLTDQPLTQPAETAWEAAIRAQYGRHGPEELDCVPSAGGGAWLLYDLIRAASRDARAGNPDHRGSGPCYIGVDVARRRDLWVAAVLEDDGGTLWLREIVTLDNKTFAEQRAEMRRLARAHRPLRILVDQTGMGEAVVEQYQEDHGALTVEGVLLSAARKLDVAGALREAFEDRRIRIPADPALWDDLHSVRAEPSASGAPRLVADRKDSDGHADRFWALALAAFGAASVAGPFEMRPGPQLSSAGLGGGPGAGAGYRADPDLDIIRSPLAGPVGWR
ncbi:hypothetical protein [Ruegeria sp.]|uniref:phage terminase large subunit family protein n=1 Tax=Ruegeria sp. TaxID=1879320 RepID=UPI003AFFD0E9